MRRTYGRVNFLVKNAFVSGFGLIANQNAEERQHEVLGVIVTADLL